MAWIAQPFPFVVDPWALLDGRANAPSGTTIQHPTWLVGANTGTSSQSPLYTKRPPWQVTGVDYPVGIPAAISLIDPTIGGNLPSGCTLASQTLTINANNVTLTSFDFTKNNGIKINNNGHTGTVVTNCLFGFSIDTPAPIILTNGSITIQYCVIDGTNANETGFVAPICQDTAGGTLLIQYCWIKNTQSDLFSMDGGTSTYQFNVFENCGIDGTSHAGSHPDFFQWTGASSGTPVNVTIKFNGFFQNCGATGTFAQGAYLANTIFGAVNISNNTMRSSPGALPTGSDGNGGLQMHSWLSGISSGSLVGTVTYNQNYCDVTDCTSFAVTRTNANLSGNINMVTGASLDASG